MSTNNQMSQYKNLVNSYKSFTRDEVLKLSDELGKSLSGFKAERGGVENTRTQVRKFYNLVKVAQTAGNAKDANVEQVKVKLRTLQAQVTYAVARKTISSDFKTFFDTSLNLIITSNDPRKLLDEFATFFESLYAYFYFYSEENKGGK